MNNNITELQGYCALQLFLDDYYYRTGAEGLGWILSGMALLQDGNSADNAMWIIWTEGLDKVHGVEERKVERFPDTSGEITPLEAFDGMIKYIEHFSYEDDVKTLLTSLRIQDDGTVGNSLVWEEWSNHLKEVLAQEGVPQQCRFRILNQESITELQGYYTFTLVLEDYYKETPSEHIKDLLESMLLNKDGRPTDPILWQHWTDALDKIREERGNEGGPSNPCEVFPIEAFEGMFKFLETYSTADEVKALLKSFYIEKNGKVSHHPYAWKCWFDSLDRVLAENARLRGLSKIWERVKSM